MYSSAWRIGIEAGGRPDSLVAALTRAAFAAMLMVVFAAGCREAPTVTDSSVIIVQPGRGATNMCEVGMRFSQVRKATGDATRHGLKERSWKRVLNWKPGTLALVPSLGAIASIGHDQPISIIEFYVRPFRAQLIPSLEIRQPFRGKLGSDLSFQDGIVSKTEVEATFGRIAQVTTNAAETLEFRRRGESFILQRGNGIEEEWYPATGVAFVFETNVVTSFKIFGRSGTNR